MAPASAPTGYSYNVPSSEAGPETSLPQNMYPTNDAGNPTTSNTAANTNPYGTSTAPTLSSTVANTGAPGSGTTGTGGTSTGRLGYESLIPFANTAAYYGSAEGQQGATLSNAADQNLNAYTTLLRQGISSDPTVRMAQAAPGIKAQEQQTQQALNSIATLPRGGAADYLSGQAYISEASNVSDLINQAYNQDLAAIGNLGVTEAQQGLAGYNAAVGAESVGGSITGGAVNIKNGIAAAQPRFDFERHRVVGATCGFFVEGESYENRNSEGHRNAGEDQARY